MLTQIFQTAIKIETTAGTAESLTNAEVAYTKSADVTPNVTIIKRPRNGALGEEKAKRGSKSATAVLEYELAGKGSSGVPQWAPLLQACGMAKSSQVYTHTSTESDWKTVTIGVKRHSHYHLIWGAMGTYEISIPPGEEIPTIKFTMTGLWDQPTDASLFTDATPVIPPMALGSTITLDAHVPLIGTFTLSAGNNVILRTDHTNDTGHKVAHITTRTPTGTIDPEANLLATYDPIDKLVDETEVDIQYVLNGGSNNTITIDIARAQYTAVPYGDRGGIITHQIAYQANGDNVVITFS